MYIQVALGLHYHLPIGIVYIFLYTILAYTLVNRDCCSSATVFQLERSGMEPLGFAHEMEALAAFLASSHTLLSL
jgi:hypothetical protein